MPRAAIASCIWRCTPTIRRFPRSIPAEARPRRDDCGPRCETNARSVLRRRPPPSIDTRRTARPNMRELGAFLSAAIPLGPARHQQDRPRPSRRRLARGDGPRRRRPAEDKTFRDGQHEGRRRRRSRGRRVSYKQLSARELAATVVSKAHGPRHSVGGVIEAEPYTLPTGSESTHGAEVKELDSALRAHDPWCHESVLRRAGSEPQFRRRSGARVRLVPR